MRDIVNNLCAAELPMLKCKDMSKAYESGKYRALKIIRLAQY